MNSSSNALDADDSVVCLDTTTEDDNDDAFSVSDFVNLEKTLPPGAAPEGFILLDESVDGEKASRDEKSSKIPKDNNDVSAPIFKVVFRDEAVARQYKKRVRAFLCKLAGAEYRESDSEASSLVLDIWSKKSGRKRRHDVADDDKTTNDNGGDKNDSESDSLLFTIEKKPAGPMGQDRLDVPTYGMRFDRIMATSSEEAKDDENKEKAACGPRMSCWNCLGNHSIRDCTQPRNPMEIARNRQSFQSRAGPKCSRYHVDDEQKHGHFVPGQISGTLKHALGCRENELPFFIYRMRMLGYPPGWLKEARLQHSGLNLYDSNGLRELDPMEEPGQIAELGDKDQYDVKKIHDFPGFNVPPPPGTREEERRYWLSDQYHMHSKDTMLALMNEKKVDGYKRKKLKRTPDTKNSNSEQAPGEMDIVEEADESVVEVLSESEEFVPPLPKSPVRPPLPPYLDESPADSPKIAVNTELEAVGSPAYVDSPTLADLERRKKQLLEELDDASTQSPPSTPLSTKHVSLISQTVDTDAETPESKRTIAELVTPSRGTVKSVALGTPILESTSPYNRLPSVEKFSKDVCDIMHFENLPDSTGKYEQMTGILQKVRSTLADIQHD